MNVNQQFENYVLESMNSDQDLYSASNLCEEVDEFRGVKPFEYARLKLEPNENDRKIKDVAIVSYYSPEKQQGSQLKFDHSFKIPNPCVRRYKINEENECT